MLKLMLLGAGRWIATGLRDTALAVFLMRAWDMLTARRMQAARPRNYVLTGEPGVFQVRGYDSLVVNLDDSRPPQIG